MRPSISNSTWDFGLNAKGWHSGIKSEVRLAAIISGNAGNSPATSPFFMIALFESNFQSFRQAMNNPDLWRWLTLRHGLYHRHRTNMRFTSLIRNLNSAILGCYPYVLNKETSKPECLFNVKIFCQVPRDKLGQSETRVNKPQLLLKFGFWPTSVCQPCRINLLVRLSTLTYANMQSLVKRRAMKSPFFPPVMEV